MRRLLVLLTVLALLWCLWWLGATALIAQQTRAWFDARRGEGWQAEAQIDRSGFPTRLGLTLSNVALADPELGTALRVDRLRLSAPGYWPGDPVLDLPQTPMILSHAGQQLSLTASNARAALELHPNTALTLEAFRGKSGPWQVALNGNPLAKGDAVQLTMVQSDSEPDRYALDLTTERLAPLPALQQLWPEVTPPADWPETLNKGAVSASVTFDRPWDRAALGQRRPQPRHISFHEGALDWGPLQLTLSGAVEIDSRGRPEGQLRLTAARWQEVLNIATDSGLIPPEAQARTQLMLGGLAAIGGGGPDLTVDLILAEGQMRIGPLPLGPAPRITLP